MRRVSQGLSVLVIAGAVFVLAPMVEPSAATLTRWTNFGSGWANAGWAHDDALAKPDNGPGDTAGIVQLLSSTEFGPRRIRIRVVSEDDNPVEVFVDRIWIGCTVPGRRSWSREISDRFPAAVTPPATMKLYDRRLDGPVEACEVQAWFSTWLYSDDLHHFRVNLQAKHLDA